MLQQERMSREESAQITPRCFRFHVSCSLRKPIRVLRLGVKIHRKGIFLDKHIWNQIARCSAHGSLLGMGGGWRCNHASLRVLRHKLGCPVGPGKEHGWTGSIPR